MRSFRDRREAGRALAGELMGYRDRGDVLVFGLARGGLPVAWEIAAALHAPLDVFLVRKLGVPNWSELAMGALASGGGVVMNDDVVSSLRITDEQVRAVIDSETAELARRCPLSFYLRQVRASDLRCLRSNGDPVAGGLSSDLR